MDKIGIKTTPSDIELTYFYKGIILFYEATKSDVGKTYWLPDEQLQAVLAYCDLSIDWIKQSEKLSFPNGYKKEAVQFILLKRTNNENNVPIMVLFLKHLRNCFAHGRFSKTEIDGKTYFCFEDKYDNGNLSMVAQIPLIRFYLIIEGVKDTINKSRNNII